MRKRVEPRDFGKLDQYAERRFETMMMLEEWRSQRSNIR